MHVPGLVTRLKDAVVLLEAYGLSEAEHADLARIAHSKVAEVSRSLENFLKTNTKGEEPCRKR